MSQNGVVVLGKYSENILARAVWIRTSPDDATLDHLENNIPTSVKDEPNVLMALAAVATDKKQWGQAEGYLTQALQKAEGHPKIKEQLGRLLLQEAELWKYALTEKQPTSDEKARISKAIEYLTAASAEWRKQNKTKQLVEVKLVLVAAYRAIGDNAEAENNIRLAYELDNSNELAACGYAALLANQGERDRAIGLLAPLTVAPENLVIADLYAQLLVNRNSNNDKEDALTVLKDRVSALNNAMPVFRFDYIKQIILLSVTLKGEDETIGYLEQVPPELLSDVSRQILKASVYCGGQNRLKSIEMAIEICQGDRSNLEWHEKRNLAILLQSLGQWEQAVNIWQEIVPCNCLSRDLYNLLEAARRTDDAEIILNVCRQLRENQIWDDRAVNLELEYRERHNDSDTAVSIMQEYLTRCDNEENAAMIRLRLSYLGMRTRRYDLLEKDRMKLPDVTKVNAHNGRLVVEVLSYGPNPLDAVDYAYELWRQYPDDENANLALIGSILLIGPDVQVPKYDTVQPGAAVLYKDEETQTKTWHIVENSSEGNIENSRNEYSQEHPISQRILGKSKGESFYLVKDELEERKATLGEITSKYLYRFRKCSEEFKQKFPENKVFRSFPGFKSDGTVNLEPMKRIAQMGEKRAKHIMAIYDAQLIPIYMLAKCKGVSEFVAMNYYASDPELEIKTCFGSVDEWNHSIAAASRAEKFVLDISALVTLLLMDDSFWTTIDQELVVSEGTYNRLKSIEPAQGDYVREGGWISSEQGQLSFGLRNVNQMKSEQNKVEEFIRQVSNNCRIESGVDLTEVPAKERQAYIDALGQHNAESFVLAAREDHVLWTDDLALACLARSELGCMRMWSQVVVSLFAGGRAADLNLKLFKYGYTFTRVTLNELKTAVEQAKWQVNSEPLSNILSVFSDGSVSPESIATLFGQFVKYIWQNTMEFTAQQIMLVVLGELSRRQLGPFIIAGLPVETIFGLDCVNAHKVRMVINRWVRTRIDNTPTF